MFIIIITTNLAIPLLVNLNRMVYRSGFKMVSRIQELAQVRAIDHSLLLDYVCGTTYVRLYLRDSEQTSWEFRWLLKMHLFY